MARSLLKRSVVGLVVLAILVLVFILVGGGELLKSAGNQAEDVKQKIEEKVEDVREKAVEKLTKSDK